MTDATFAGGSASDARLSDELKPRRGRPAQFSAEERAERAKRATRAQAMAAGVLRQRHEDEYAELYDKAKREVGLL